MFRNLVRVGLPSFKKLIAGFAFLCLSKSAFGQTTIPLTDLAPFKTEGKSWSIVGDVTADLAKANILNSVKGSGVLINLPAKKNTAADLYTNFEHGDLDLELDYMMAKESNSGIYLQGRYEIQLEDSWGVKTPTAGNNGGIYERWDEKRANGQKGYEGYPPRQNASKAPGLWQHLKISFQAPRFDASGRKTENAKILLVQLNGVNIHENVVLSGPTRGALGSDEKATGPLRFQGDHGAVAFRNIKVTNFDKPRPELVNLQYTIYKGKFDKEPDLTKLPPEAKGASAILTSTVNRIPNEYLIQYTGKLKVAEPGEYKFNLTSPGGIGILKLNTKEVTKVVGESGTGAITLSAGEIPFEILYSKYVNYIKPILGLTISGPGFREFLISDATNIKVPVDPVLVNATSNMLLRSFIDLPDNTRLTHAISVGSPEQLHYTYDYDRGTLVQAWRGTFMDATPMWQDRGDGSSKPMGMILQLSKPALTLANLSTPQATWATDTLGSHYRPKGYTLDQNDLPTFQYQIYGATVADAIRLANNGQGLQRVLTVENSPKTLYARLAEGKKIEALPKGMYLVDDKAYYLQLDDAGGGKPQIREVKDGQELIIPVRNKLSYSIIF
ncbi:3-keto-disaccharide hydrolase [Adhaeribacter aquaticus]|uniref:3-keto-disaccharide hydrolase n=1 Tax=Adhaeribacter aquaticus TaxID=299567 RepID=UPI0003F8558C|nr:DUF1080 domain-containing protein [Adhaeribacter aquaticus]